MNTKVIIGVVAAIVVVAGAAWYMTANTAGLTTGVMEEGKEDKGSSTFAALLALGGSRQCQVTVNTAEAPATGTVYISGGNIRSDVVARPANTGGKEIAAYMIAKDGYMYSWSDAAPMGVKIKMEEATAAPGKTGYDANAQVEYSCMPWIPDASKFEVPDGISFMEFNAGAGAGMPSMPKTGTPQPY